MSDKPINLAKARKAKSRELARRQADANAVKFGRSKATRQQHRDQSEKASRDLDAHKRDRPDGDAKT